MAGRYVILEFDDRDSAESFATNPHMPEQLGYKVMAMFVKPVKFCQCPDARRQDNRNWYRGSRTGLFLHKDCKRPSEFHRRGLMARLKHVFGYNLLGDEDDAG